MFTGYDIKNIPYIYYAMINNLEIAKYVLNHQYCDASVLMDSYKLVLYNKKLECDLLDIILDLKIISSELLLQKIH